MDVKGMFDLTGRVALVTGGGRGLGKVMTEALLEAGASAIITGRRAEYLDPTVAEFQGRGLTCRAIVADATQEADVARVVQDVIDHEGQIDILVNNAGQTWGEPTEALPLSRWQQVVDVNLTGIFLYSQAVGRQMIAGDRGGVIINLASVAGLSASAANIIKTIAYNTTKAGVVHFTRSLAVEWGSHHVRVNAIAPGWFPTRMSTASIAAFRDAFLARTPLGRFGEADDLKGVVVFLASDAARYITGQTIVLDGGSSL